MLVHSFREEISTAFCAINLLLGLPLSSSANKAMIGTVPSDVVTFAEKIMSFVTVRRELQFKPLPLDLLARLLEPSAAQHAESSALRIHIHRNGVTVRHVPSQLRKRRVNRVSLLCRERNRGACADRVGSELFIAESAVKDFLFKMKYKGCKDMKKLRARTRRAAIRLGKNTSSFDSRRSLRRFG